jgi:hypothetical protein
MNRKTPFILTFILIFLFAGTLSVSAYSYRSDRIGFGVGTPNAVFIYRPAPFDFRAGYDFSEGNQFVFLSGDLRLIDNRHLTGPLNISFGLGVYGKLFAERTEDMLEGGTRLPLGLSILFLDNFGELFVEIAPGFDLYPKPAFSDDPVQFWAGITFSLD